MLHCHLRLAFVKIQTPCSQTCFQSRIHSPLARLLNSGRYLHPRSVSAYPFLTRGVSDTYLSYINTYIPLPPGAICFYPAINTPLSGPVLSRPSPRPPQTGGCDRRLPRRHPLCPLSAPRPSRRLMTLMFRVSCSLTWGGGKERKRDEERGERRRGERRGAVVDANQ